MKHLFVFLFMNATFSILTLEDLSCKTQFLQFYGFGGLVQPVSYHNLVKQLNVDHCPGIEYSCCSFKDFQLSRSTWEKKVEGIKRYLTKMFRIIQKTTVLQGSLLQIASAISGKTSKSCKQIDSTFFNNPIHYDEIYYYLQNALDSFAFMQKGFYCAICDAKNHEYLGLIREPTRKVAIMNVKFCNDLIFFFREFIMFKVFFIDPMIVNTNYLLNCYEDTDKYTYKFEYMTEYQMIEDCVEKGENCEFVCKEFRFGASSELFMGNLGKFYEFYKNIENVLTKFNPAIENDIDGEFKVDEEEYPTELFTDFGILENSESHNLLKDFNLSLYEINIEAKGINLFDISDHSNYFLTNARTRSSIIKNFGLDMPGTGKLSNDVVINNPIKDNNGDLSSSSLIQSYKDADDWERVHEAEKLAQDPNKPSKAELETLVLERNKLEEEMMNEIKAKNTVHYENGVGPSNFETFSKVPDDENNCIKLGISALILFILMYK